MSRILVIFASTQGQTCRIAHRIGDELIEDGHSVDVLDVQALPKHVNPADYSASVHIGSYQRKLQKWVHSHSKELNSVPSAFFSVCLGVLQSDSKANQELERIIEDFFNSSGWHPSNRVVFAGGLAYSKYNPLLKWWMKRISAKTGGDTDTSHDYEYTDWDAVQRFSHEFSRLVTLRKTEIEPSKQTDATKAAGVNYL